jgi:hypothetical protein
MSGTIAPFAAAAMGLDGIKDVSQALKLALCPPAES